jgi:hypothetical protein
VLARRFVRVDGQRHFLRRGTVSPTSLVQVEEVPSVAVGSVTRETAAIAARREAANELATHLADRY